MSLSPAVENHLNSSNIRFEVVAHPRSSTSIQAARSAHVAPAQFAKAVVVRDREEYRMCVLPASNSLILNWVNRDYHAHYRLVSEDDLTRLFPDCETGAVPPLGQVYGMPVVWDKSLRHVNDVYFEAGDHHHLIHIGHSDFMNLMEAGDHATISCSSDTMEYYQHLH